MSALAGTVREIIFRGETLHIVVRVTDGTDVRVAVRNTGVLTTPLAWSVGQRVQVTWRPSDAQVLEP